MRTASILLALVVLGCCREAGAQVGPTKDYTVRIGDLMFGIQEIESSYCELCVGPFGHHTVFLNANQVLTRVGVIVAIPIILPVAVFTVRWKRRAST